jgi:hypothetical protein
MKICNAQIAVVIATGILGFTSAGANAGVYESYLEYSAVSAFNGNLTSNTPPFFGKVTLTEGGSGTGAFIDVHVELFDGFRFIDSGNDGTHTSFAFNLTAPGSLTQIVTSAPWTINGANPSSNNPFGNFTNGLDCCASNGAAGAIAGPLDFRVTSNHGISFLGAGDHFSSNTTGNFGPYTGGWWFSADLLGADGLTTGPVAARDLVRTVPEPATYSMILASLGIMGFIQRRRERRK